jgi:hypothetical protein
MKGSSITIEGIWEEVEKQAAKFSGRRVRVTLIPDSTHQSPERRSPKPSDESTARFLKEFAGSWVGDDLDECLKMVGKTRSRTQW